MVNETSDRPRLTAKGERTRARIVEEAAVLIHERGVAGTTLDDVKAAAEVSGSQMYHYFPDKNDLVQAVIDYQAETIVKHHRKALGNVTCAPSARELPTRSKPLSRPATLLAGASSSSKRSNPDRARPATCRQACEANSLQSQTNIRTSSGRCTCAGDSRSRRASRGSIPTNLFCDYQTYPCLASPRQPCCMADSVSAQFTETSAHLRKRWRSCFRSDHPMSATGAWVPRTIGCQVRYDRLCQPQLALVTAITCPAYLTPSVRSDGGDGTQRRLCPTSMR